MGAMTLTIALIVVAGIVAWLLDRLWRTRLTAQSKEAARELADIASMGDVFPTSLHPVIDLDRCMGSGACVAACPEKKILGVVDGRAVLLNPLACVGHGACLDACPVEAIRLVFGSTERGVELPRVSPEFETSQPGVYVIGELGGMGLIRNAIAQGTQAAAHVVARGRRGGTDLDAVVVGAGPAGIAATLELMRAGYPVELLERESFGGTIAHYPRKKLVMTGALDLPLYGKVSLRTMTKEQLGELFEDVRKKTGLEARTGELVTTLSAATLASGESGWEVHATSGVRRTRNVLLALGRRGAPQKLGVPGEELAKVFYRLLEPEVFAGNDVLVVGGGNSAVECALALSELGGCRSVAISYRRDAFARCRAENRRKIDEAIAQGKVRALLPSTVRSISEREVVLEEKGAEVRIPNDAVIVQIGGTSPTELLASFGVAMVTKYGER